VPLIFKGQSLGPLFWELIFPGTLHSIPAWLCTATNAAPCEMLFPFPRQSMIGGSLPGWMSTPGTIRLKEFVWNKSASLCVEEIRWTLIQVCFDSIAGWARNDGLHIRSSPRCKSRRQSCLYQKHRPTNHRCWTASAHCITVWVNPKFRGPTRTAWWRLWQPSCVKKVKQNVSTSRSLWECSHMPILQLPIPVESPPVTLSRASCGVPLSLPT